MRRHLLFGKGLLQGLTEMSASPRKHACPTATATVCTGMRQMMSAPPPPPPTNRSPPPPPTPGAGAGGSPMKKKASLPFHCTLCSASFATRGDLKAHVQSAHPSSGGQELKVTGGGAKLTNPFAASTPRPMIDEDILLDFEQPKRGGRGGVRSAASFAYGRRDEEVSAGRRFVKRHPSKAENAKNEAESLTSRAMTGLPSKYASSLPPPPPSLGAAAASSAPVATSTAAGIPNSSKGRTTPLRPEEVEELLEKCGEDDFPCEICGKIFKGEGDLLQHLEEKHPDGTMGVVEEPAVDNVVESPVVEASSGQTIGGLPPAPAAPTAAEGKQQPTGLDALMIEMQRNESSGVTPPIRVVCSLCENSARAFTAQSALLSHIVNKHPQVDALSALKDMVAKSTTNLKKTFPCPHCNKVFSSGTALMAHIESKHPNAAKPATSTEDVLANAKLSAYPPLAPETKNKWWCHVCEKGFSSNRALLGHQTDKHGRTNEALPCPGCKRILPDAYALKEHVQLAHKDIDLDDLQEEVELVCEECNRCFIDWDNFEAHQAKHGHKGVKMMEGPQQTQKKKAPKQVVEAPSFPSRPPGRGGNASGQQRPIRPAEVLFTS